MKKLLALSVLALFAFTSVTTSFHSFKTKTIDGKDFDLASLKGKKVLVVNTASECGYTPQYADLQKLYDTYKDKNFVIIGFPANNFGAQEPGTNGEIKEFCKKNYGVTFPMMQKISVKGTDMDPIYKWLTSKAENGKMDQEVKWNFFKFMINEDGTIYDFAPSGVKPMDEKITKWIEKK